MVCSRVGGVWYRKIAQRQIGPTRSMSDNACLPTIAVEVPSCVAAHGPGLDVNPRRRLNRIDSPSRKPVMCSCWWLSSLTCINQGYSVANCSGCYQRGANGNEDKLPVVEEKSHIASLAFTAPQSRSAHSAPPY